MSESFLQRYRNGQRAIVWKELVALGPSALQEPLVSDASAVAHEIVSRSYHNLALIAERLVKLGYRFADPSATLKEATPEDLEAITEVERRLGRLPLIVRAWYQRLSSVSLEQVHSQIYNRTGLDPEIAGLGLNNVWIFRPLRDCLDLRSEMLKEVEEAGDSSDWLRSFLPFGGYASNSNPKGLHLPADGVDAPIYNDGGGDICFVEELRTAFAWGGFPYWKHLIPGSKQRKNRSPLGFSPDFAPILANLAEGLLEI